MKHKRKFFSLSNWCQFYKISKKFILIWVFLRSVSVAVTNQDLIICFSIYLCLLTAKSGGATLYFGILKFLIKYEPSTAFLRHTLDAPRVIEDWSKREVYVNICSLDAQNAPSSPIKKLLVLLDASLQLFLGTNFHSSL